MFRESERGRGSLNFTVQILYVHVSVALSWTAPYLARLNTFSISRNNAIIVDYCNQQVGSYCPAFFAIVIRLPVFYRL